MFVLTNQNYHSVEARQHYMGSSMFKDFRKCEVMALARVKGEYEEKTTTALMFGSYVDAYFSNELDDFIKNTPELFTKQGTLKSDFKGCEEVIKAIEEDEVFTKYMSGEKQVIMTGEIAGVPFKIKMDVYHRNKIIVDLKVMKDMEDVWIDQEGRRVCVDFVEVYGYDISGAIYQEIERQQHLRETGEDRRLPFLLAVATKEECPDKAIFKIDQEYLDAALEIVKEEAPRYWNIIQGKEEPVGCGHCPVCRKKHKLEEYVPTYSKLIKERKKQ